MGLKKKGELPMVLGCSCLIWLVIYEALCFWEGFGFEVMNAFGNQVCKRFKNLEATKCMLKDLFLK